MWPFINSGDKITTESFQEASKQKTGRKRNRRETRGHADAARTAHHTSLPCAELELDGKTLNERERTRLSDGSLSDPNRSLLDFANLRITRSLDGLLDITESSLGGSESNSSRFTRRSTGDTRR